MICSMYVGSAETVGRFGLMRSSNWVPGQRAPSDSTIPGMRCCTSTGSAPALSVPRSVRARTSRSSTRRCRRSASALMSSETSRRVSSESPPAQDPRPAVDRGDRGPELVGQDAEECVADLLRDPCCGDVAQDDDGRGPFDGRGDRLSGYLGRVDLARPERDRVHHELEPATCRRELDLDRPLAVRAVERRRVLRRDEEPADVVVGVQPRRREGGPGGLVGQAHAALSIADDHGLAHGIDDGRQLRRRGTLGAHRFAQDVVQAPGVLPEARTLERLRARVRGRPQEGAVGRVEAARPLEADREGADRAALEDQWGAGQRTTRRDLRPGDREGEAPAGGRLRFDEDRPAGAGGFRDRDLGIERPGSRGRPVPVPSSRGCRR